MQRGHRHSLHRRYSCLFLARSGSYPGGRLLGCNPGGTLPRKHGWSYSSCYYPQANLRAETKVETQTDGWREGTKDERENRGCKGRIIDSNVANQRRRCGAFLPDAARRWLLARCCAAVATCPMLLCCGFLPDAARGWLLARCCAAVASLSFVVECIMSLLRADSEGLGVSKFRKCRARCGESKINIANLC